MDAIIQCLGGTREKVFSYGCYQPMSGGYGEKDVYSYECYQLMSGRYGENMLIVMDAIIQCLECMREKMFSYDCFDLMSRGYLDMNALIQCLGGMGEKVVIASRYYR